MPKFVAVAHEPGIFVFPISIWNSSCLHRLVTTSGKSPSLANEETKQQLYQKASAAQDSAKTDRKFPDNSYLTHWETD